MRSVRVGSKSLHAASFVFGAVGVVHLEVQLIPEDQSEEQSATVDAGAAEHPARRQTSHARELLEHVRQVLLTDRHCNPRREYEYLEVVI